MWGLTGECTARVGRAWKTREINGWKVRGLPVRGPRPPRCGLFTVRWRPAPPAPTPSLPGRGRVAFARLPPAAEGGRSGVGGGLARAPGEESPPPPTSLASPIEHGSLVATQLIAKTRLGVCVCVCVCVCVGVFSSVMWRSPVVALVLVSSAADFKQKLERTEFI